MKKAINVALILLILIFYILPVEARQGCCSHHSGVCSYQCPNGGTGHRCCDGTSLSATCAPYYSTCGYSPPPQPKSESTLEPQKTDPTTLSVVSGQVTQIVDGDTIKVNLEGQIYTVRLIGIDTPETKYPRKPVECFGQEATVHLTSLINGATVYLTKDKIGDTVDVYGRLLRYISLGGDDIDAQMIKDGYAYAYTKYPFDRKDEYVQYQKEAEVNKVGLWAPGICGNPEEGGVVAGVATETVETLKDNQTNLSEEKPPQALSSETNQPNTDKTDGNSYGMGAMIVIVAIGVGVYYFVKRKKKPTIKV